MTLDRAARVCNTPGCPRLTSEAYCDQCARTRSRNHPGVSRQARGYDRAYERERAALIGAPCVMRLPGCTGTATTAQHTDDGQLVPACAHCNFADGARRARNMRTADVASPWPVWHGREIVALMGAPGSGKSTYAQQFAHVITTDEIRMMTALGALTHQNMATVYDRAFDQIVRLLGANQTAVFDSMLSNPLTRQRVLRVARAWKALATLVVFDTPLDLCIARQEGRAYPVPPEVVTESHARIAEQYAALTTEGWIAVRWVRGDTVALPSRQRRQPGQDGLLLW